MPALGEEDARAAALGFNRTEMGAGARAAHAEPVRDAKERPMRGA